MTLSHRDSTDLLEVADERVLEVLARDEDLPSAHYELLVQLANRHITTEALTRFFRRIKATRSERDKMLRRWSKDGQRRFGDCWAEVRPSPAP